jgi:hypothetical protein
MLESVVVLALLTVPDGMRLIAILMVISRPRPVQNLFAYWVGCLIINVFVLLIPLLVLHFTPPLRSFVEGLIRWATATATAGSSGVQSIQIGIGVLALLIAAVMTARLRLRQRASLPATGGNTSTLVQDSNTPATISRLLGGGQDAATEGGSAIRRLLGRAYKVWENGSIYKAWKNGSVWVSLLMGVTYSPPQTTIALTIIAASGAPIGAQIMAASAYVVVLLAIVEITLVTHLFAPAKTEAVLRLLRDWLQAHSRQILIVFLAVVGFWLVATGLRIV